MNDIEEMLRRQALWQKSRQSLSWPEKIRQAERLRESLRRWRAKPIGGIVRPAVPSRDGTEAK
jgi:hypothetical protein